ncbi:hypothetical protein A2U01_0086554 [Trifolium medium]|uniref:Uncharacterized protein n=1 Tax=Trifolium medium TaxID=97028 RepID=A0A392TYW4_9FABA|nr:hypothetical protein [Trifolium medium]
MMEGRWELQTEVHYGYHVPLRNLVSAIARIVSWAAIATLIGVFSRSMLIGVHGSMRTGAYHFSHTSFFQSEHMERA